MIQALYTINISGLLAIIAICCLIWISPDRKMRRVPERSIILERKVLITKHGGISYFDGEAEMVTAPINNLYSQAGQLRTLLIY
jgi:hypothetical protein